MVCDWPIRMVAVERAEPGPELPVYQATVFAEPLTSDVDEPSGAPVTRSGGCTAATVPTNTGAPNAATFELVTERVAASSVCSVMTPPLTVEGVDVPVMASIFDSRVWTLSVTLSWFPVAPDATNVSAVPLTVMVLPATKLEDKESVPAMPDRRVAPVTGPATGKTWLVTTPPLAVPSVLKKLSPAVTAEAATNDVLASVPIAAFRAAFKLVVVSVVVAPMAKL